MDAPRALGKMAHGLIRDGAIIFRTKTAALDTNAFHAIQVEQTIRALPLLLFFHGCAAFCIHVVTADTATSKLKLIWAAAALVSCVPFAVIFSRWHAGAFRYRTKLAQDLLELSGLIFGFCWALPTAIYATSQVQASVLPIIFISLTMMGITVISLLRVPVAAVVFSALLTATIARSAYLALGDYRLMAAAVTSIYGLVLIGMALTSHSYFVQRTKTDLALKQQKDFTELLLSDFERGSHDWLWETDVRGAITYASPRLAEFLGTPDAMLNGQSLRTLLAARLEPESWQRFEDAFAGTEDIKPMRLRVRDSAATLQITARPLPGIDGSFSGWRGVGRDITDIIEAEYAAKRAISAAEASSTAKSRFLAIVSHELRTPIHAIVGYADLLARDKDTLNSERTRKEFSEAIQTSAHQLQGLINDILDATRLERGALRLVEQTVDVAELVESVIRLSKPQMDAQKVSVVGKLTDGVAAEGDLSRLKQALQNVLLNAIKFSPSGGIVYVEMLKTAESGLAIEIRDAGAGIAKDDIDRLFEPFSQLDDSHTRSFGGLGLGLAIARRIMVLHGGDVSIISYPGGGTTVSLTLPPSRLNWASVQHQSIERKTA